MASRTVQFSESLIADAREVAASIPEQPEPAAVDPTKKEWDQAMISMGKTPAVDLIGIKRRFERIIAPEGSPLAPKEGWGVYVALADLLEVQKQENLPLMAKGFFAKHGEEIAEKRKLAREQGEKFAHEQEEAARRRWSGNAR